MSETRKESNLGNRNGRRTINLRAIALAIIIFLLIESRCAAPVFADVNPTGSETYMLYDGSGNLVFFRGSGLTDGDEETVDGTTGTVWRIETNATANDGYKVHNAYASQDPISAAEAAGAGFGKSDILSIRVAPGHTINLGSCNYNYVNDRFSGSVHPNTFNEFSWFQHMPNLKTADLRGFDFSSMRIAYGGQNAMFFDDPNLEYVDLSSCDFSGLRMTRGAVFETTAQADYPAARTSSIKTLKLSNANFSNLNNFYQYVNPNDNSIDFTFFDFCDNLEVLEVEGTDFSGIIDLPEMFLHKYDPNDPTSILGYKTVTPKLTTIKASGLKMPEINDLTTMFQGLPEVTHIDLSKADFSETLSGRALFRDCPKLTYLSLREANLGYANEFTYWFACDSTRFVNPPTNELTVDFTGMITRQSYIQTWYMFCKRWSTKKITIIGFDTSKSTIFSYMFSDCYFLEEIEGLETFDTSKGTSFRNMFANNYNLRELDLSSFDVSAAVPIRANSNYFDGIFANCQRLESLDIGTWKISKGSSATRTLAFKDTFANTPMLRRIVLGEASIGTVGEANRSAEVSGLGNLDPGTVFDLDAEDYYISGYWINEDTGSVLAARDLYPVYLSDPINYAGTWTWMPITVRVTFDNNAANAPQGIISGVMDEQELPAVRKSSLATNLPANTYRDDAGKYAFDGWNTAPDGSGEDFGDMQAMYISNMPHYNDNAVMLEYAGLNEYGEPISKTVPQRVYPQNPPTLFPEEPNNFFEIKLYAKWRAVESVAPAVPAVPAEPFEEAPPTGDDSNLVLWALVTGAALFAIVTGRRYLRS